jgi:hypothetical protein
VVLAPSSFDFSKPSSEFRGKFWKPTKYAEDGTEDYQSIIAHPINDQEAGSRYFDFSLKRPFTLSNISGKFSYFSKEATKGSWRGFRHEINLPRGSFYGIPTYSHLGALFGNSLYHVLTATKSSAPLLYHGMFALWLDFLKTSGPTFYEVTNLSMTVVDMNPVETHAASFSTDVGLSLRHAFLSEALDSFRDGIQQTFDGELQKRIRLALCFAGFMNGLERRGVERVQESGTVFGSDNAAIYDFLHPRDSTDLVKIGFYFSKYYPNMTAEYLSSRFSGTNPFLWKREQEQQFQAVARRVGFPARNSNIPTGCGGCQAPIFRIFVKSSNIRGKLVYNPIGLPKGKNCILECMEFYLRENQAHFSLQASQVHYHPEIMVLLGISDTLDLSDESVRATLTKVTNISFVVFMEKIEDGNSSIVQLPWQLNPDSPDGVKPLKLLVFKHGTDLFGFKVWHACVVEDFSMLRDKKKCNICSEWFARESKHFKNCRACVCGKFYQEDGKHYASCRGKAFEASKAKENGTMAISNIAHHKSQLKRDIWFADFECFQDKNGRHIPYMAALKCIGKPDTKVFWGETCLKEFVEFITTPAKGVKGYLYCHNGSGYDFNLILVGLLKYCGTFGKKPLNVLMRGTKILTCQISTKPNLVLRDSFLLIPTSLSKICKDLKIKQEFAKLHFDHSKIFSFESALKHKQEVVKYCIQDVVALEQVFSMFANAMWDISPVLLQSSMSLASHALEMWKIMEKGPVLSTLAIPDYETYLVLREMYHGGRVLATVPKYDSALFNHLTEEDEEGNFTFFDSEGNTLMDFDEILENIPKIFKKEDKEMLKQVDVVSLYPHCMYEKAYPTGALITPVEFGEDDGKAIALEMMMVINSGKWASFEHDGDTVKVEQEFYSTLKEEMFRHCYQVTMDCPQDLIVAFVMRKENGAPIQNLNPLVKHWITGVELFEAVKIGYKLKTIHCRFGWQSSNHVFKKYIGALFSIKEKFKNDKSNIMYLCSKLLMNALSGKFGQKIVCRVTKLMSELPDDPEKEFENLLNISNELIEAMDGGKTLEPVGYLFTGEKRTADMETNLPTHLSVFILAHSRRKMSKMLRFVNGYKDKDNTLLYTDTDSMVVTQSTYEKLVAKGWIGSKLGQLEDEFPRNIIVAARFIAPKVYCLMMLAKLPDSPKAAVCYKIRCKGIPHRGDVFFANSYELDDREFKVRVAEIDESISSGVKDLGKRFYVVKSKEDNKVVMVNPFINIHICDLILTEKYYLQVHFGSILKETKIKFQLVSKWITRSLGVTSWWKNPKCPRILKDEEGYEITSCKGSE